jgi:hypothetical protein
MKRKITVTYVLLTAFYLFMTFIYPVDQATTDRRHLSLAQARFIGLSFALPMIIVWFVALFCSFALFEYSRKIKKSADGKVLAKLAFGVQLIAWYLPLRAIIKIVLNYIASRYPSLLNAANDIITYVNLVVPLIAFVIISRATFELGRLAKIKHSLRAIYGLGLTTIILGVGYCFASFRVEDTIAQSNWLITPQTALSLPVRTLTIVIPTIFMWFIGLVAVYQIHLYQKQVKGIVYRQLWHLLSMGLIAVILLSIAIQFITVTAASLQSLPFAAVMVIAYCLLLLFGLAFIMMARGVRQINKLDEI